jgi:hypothetical protein
MGMKLDSVPSINKDPQAFPLAAPNLSNLSGGRGAALKGFDAHPPIRIAPSINATRNAAAGTFFSFHTLPLFFSSPTLLLPHFPPSRAELTIVDGQNAREEERAKEGG